MKYPSTLIILFMIHSAIVGQDHRKAEPYAGEQQLKRFFCQEVVYPEEDLKANTEGTVVLTFQVDSAGKMSGLQVKEPVSPGIDKEALRLMSMSIWTPAYHLGKRVTTFVDYPIKFNIKKYKKHCKKRGFDQAELPYTPVDTSNTVYNSEDVDAAPKPIFDDPRQSLDQFIIDNLKYPEDAFRQNISGTVVLSFIVETNGLISHIVPEEPLGGGCTQEAIRIIELLKWMPGIKNKLGVRTKTNIKITFKLADYQDLQYVPAGQNQGI